MRTAKTLFRLGGCPGWSESSLGAHATLLVLSQGGSNCVCSSPFCKQNYQWQPLITICSLWGPSVAINAPCLHVLGSQFPQVAEPGTVDRLEACPLGMQVAPSSIPTSGTFFCGDLVIKKKFYSHSPSSADSRRAVVSYWWKNVH